MQAVLRCEHLSCYREQWLGAGSSAVTGVTTAFLSGEMCGITGPNGCGKGLLLNLLGMLERPDYGEVFILEQAASLLPEDNVQHIRNQAFGFLFNHPCLLPSFSLAENVAMPLFRVNGGDVKSVRNRTREVLDFCGVGHLEHAIAGRLNATERRAAALARALVHQPPILLIISPDGTPELLGTARRAAVEMGLCVLWAGNEPELPRFSHRLLQMNDGNILNDQRL